MADKPTTAAGYRSEQVELVRATCLYVATKLSDMMEDLVVIGGLVPSLLVKQDELPAGTDAHVGTMDLDVGLTLALLEEGRYRALTERLRRAGFEQDVNEEGNPTRQRWKIERTEKITVDFLIQPSLIDDRGGRLRDIERDFAAVIAPGLHLAFRDHERVTLSGKTILGEQATRDVRVCGPGAYVVLKSLAFRLRGENKDASPHSSRPPAEKKSCAPPRSGHPIGEWWNGTGGARGFMRLPARAPLRSPPVFSPVSSPGG